MQKIKMSRGVTLTFEEGCKKYLENCRQRNLREGTINHYRQTYSNRELNRWSTNVIDFKRYLFYNSFRLIILTLTGANSAFNQRKLFL